MGRTKDIELLEYFQEHKIVSLEDLKRILQTGARMTAFRALRRLDYLSSYSHRGQFYTLRHIPEFDQSGVWSFRSVHFSKFGNLITTAKTFVEGAEGGCTSAELEHILHVEVKHTLLELTRRGEIIRRKMGRSQVYMSIEKGRQRQQWLTREDRQSCVKVGMGLASEVLADKIKAAIHLFFSMLDEKQRRLYAGLEAAKVGHGGDRMVAELLSLDAHTVSKGRRELLEDSIDRSGIRKKGGGRKALEKKH